jgi:uncharacterized membrane protein YraQ (UPF0718 family)
MPINLNAQIHLLSSLSFLIAVPFILVALSLVFYLFRQRATARRVGVNASVAGAIPGNLQS